MRDISVKHTQNLADENKKLHLDLQSMKHELDARSKQLGDLSVQTDCDRRNLEFEKQKNAMRSNHLMLATLEDIRADENVLKLVEQHKREKETALSNIKKLSKQLHVKHRVELDIKHLMGKLQVIKQLPGSEDSESGKIIAELTEELAEKIEEMDYIENFNQGLVVQENKVAVELQEARKLAIDALQHLPGPTSGLSPIGIRMIGELDSEAFLNVCRQKFPEDYVKITSANLCKKWQNEINNPEWHPFMVATVNGKELEVIRGDDKKLQELKREYGEEAYAAVATALTELNEHSGGSSRVPFPELWNYKEGRKAKSKEMVQHVIKLVKASKK